MTLRKLTPKEEVVFDLIVDQREQKHDDLFTYYITQGQEELQANGRATRYGIGAKEQFDIIKGLAEDGIIDADWIIEKSDGAKYKFARHDDDWLQDKPEYLPFFSEDEKYDDFCYINIGFKQIELIRSLIPRYTCRLRYDGTKSCFVVDCEDGRKYVIEKLVPNKRPSEILKYALKQFPEPVTRDELNGKKGTLLYVGNKESIATMVFDPDSVIHHELEPFVERISSKTICVSPTAKLSLAELKDLQTA